MKCSNCGSEERLVRHGIIRRDDGEYQLCSEDADVPSKQIVWVPESLAARQARTLQNYHEFQNELKHYFGAGQETK